MQIAGGNPRTAMELMRHSDIKLTTQIYTDANQLPKVAAIHRLPSFWNAIHTATSDMAKCGKMNPVVSQGIEGSIPDQ